MTDLGCSTPFVDRLERLERENRRFKLAAGASTLLLFGWTACSLTPEAQGVVTAERFALLAPDGSERGSLELDEQGHPMLLLTEERSAAMLTLNGPALLLRGADGKTSALVGIDSRNTSKIELTSERIMDGVRLSARPDGSCGVYVLDPSGRERGGLEALSTGGSSLFFRDQAGRTRSQIGVDPAGLPNLLLLDENGARRMGMLVQEDGNPLLELQDQRARARVQLATQFDGSPRLEMLREDGGASFTAP